MKQTVPKFLFSQRYITLGNLEIPYIIDYTLDNEWYFITLAELVRVPEEYWK